MNSQNEPNENQSLVPKVDAASDSPINVTQKQKNVNKTALAKVKAENAALNNQKMVHDQHNKKFEPFKRLKEIQGRKFDTSPNRVPEVIVH